jgi:hypothetical protein
VVGGAYLSPVIISSALTCALSDFVAGGLGLKRMETKQPNTRLVCVREPNPAKFLLNSIYKTREPAFNWWVRAVLQARTHIIALVKKRSTRFLKNMHKFGIEVPRSVAEAYAPDKKNGNTLWADSIAKEMKNVRIAFKILANGDKDPIGFQRMRCHMIFDIKMEDLRRKSRLVAGGHMTDAPATTTFASVVSRETV